MPLTARERYQRYFDRRDLDRCPIWDSAWHSTGERWIGEGMPRDAPFHRYFGLDQIASFGLGGGYVVASDHSIPDSVSLAEFQRFVDQAKKLASY